MEQAEQFAKRLVAGFNEGDDSTLNALVDWQRIINRSLEGLSMPANDRLKFDEEALRGVRARNALQETAVSVSLGGDARLLRLYERDGQRRLLVRLILEEGVNYLDFELDSTANGVRAIDMYNHLTGENISASFRRVFLPIVAQMNRSWITRAAMGDGDFLDSFDEISKLAKHVRSGRHAAALEVYHSLPASVKADKNILVLRYQAASSLPDDQTQELVDAVADFKKHHPDDACIDFLSIDTLALLGKYDESLAALDRFDRSVGGDPYLDAIRTDVLLAAEKPREAVAAARRVATALPEIKKCCQTFLGAGILVGDNQAIYDGLVLLEKHHNDAAHDLRGEESLTGFVSSELGKRWHREHGIDIDAAPVLDSQEPSPAAVAETDSSRQDTQPGFGSAFGGGFGSRVNLDSYHTWEDRTGRFTVEAQFVSLDADGVKLKKKDGKEITVPLQKLADDSIAQAMRCKAEQAQSEFRQRQGFD
ncbi:MAG: SHD1 domain-containing protein [Planctomycetota bacterium]